MVKFEDYVARWRSGNAGVCKTSIRRFKSGTRLINIKCNLGLTFHMEYGKSDYIVPNEIEYDEGYSEKQAALDNEIQAGGWKNLGSFVAYKTSSRQKKIFLTYQAVSSNLYHVISLYLISVRDGAVPEDLLTELKKLRMIQDILLNCLLWEPEGELDKNMIPQEVWDLIA